MPIELRDDGTLDTVYECTECGQEIRYTFDGTSGQTYDEFLEWSAQDAADEHECEESQ